MIFNVLYDVSPFYANQQRRLFFTSSEEDREKTKHVDVVVINEKQKPYQSREQNTIECVQ